VLAAVLLAVATPALAKKKQAPAELTPQGESLKADYTKQMQRLQAQLVDALPKISDQAKAEYKAALEAEAKAKADMKAAQDQLGKIGAAKGLIGHATGHWIPKADRGIKAGEQQLAKAKTQAEKDAAKAEIKKWQDNRKAGEEALAERTANYEKLKAEEPKLKKQVADAQADLAKAQDRVAKSLDALRLDRALQSDRLDTKLAKFVVLKEGTPHNLAAFAQKDAAHKRLVDQLLADDKLMLQMAYAGGAKDGNYGRAMQIYTDIQKASNKAKAGIFHELALAIALEHATPVKQQNAEAAKDAPEVVDPVGRYKHYEQAYLNKDLDPYFDRHEAWELRFVVNGNEPDEILAWGREMLRNYRPDLITTKDDRWRYVSLVRTCVRYGSQENKNDKPELQFFQNILMNGGICGRRAFFGRFILRSFGVPTVAKPQTGHAALGRWTPDGWVACLGAGWGTGWAPGREMAAKDFLAMTQARELKDYMQVQRAHWIGDVNGETRKLGFESGRHKTEFWNSVALNTQKQLIETAGTKELAAVGEELGEANESKVKYPFVSSEVSAEDRKINVDNLGVITIPAAAATSPNKSTGKVLFLDSSLGGKQMHYSRNGGDQDVVYNFDAPKAGTYELTMRVAVPAWKQNINIIVNGKATTIELPHTVGMWETTKPIKLQLKQGKNTLTMSRKGVKQEVATKGFTIRDYTLSPVGGQQ
jgi:predicted  nucleic acid-binding Zn-ribbon protein